MAKPLYMDDCYLTEFEANIVSIKDGKFIVLDQTAFYPNSGGQPHDTGWIIGEEGSFNVIFTGKFEGVISHEIEPIEGKELKEGEKIIGKINWERRHTLMRYHTAAHILSGLLHKETGAMITGNQLNEDKGRIDFSLEEYDAEKMKEYVERGNEIVEQAKPIKIYTVPREQAEQMPSVSKLAAGLPPGIKEIRIVEIEDFDLQADGGTHLRNTSEVGKIVFLKAENKGKNNRRVYFKLE